MTNKVGWFEQWKGGNTHIEPSTWERIKSWGAMGDLGGPGGHLVLPGVSGWVLGKPLVWWMEKCSRDGATMGCKEGWG